MSVIYICRVTGSLVRNSVVIFFGNTMSFCPLNPCRLRMTPVRSM